MIIPNTVTYLGEYSFANSGIESFTIPSTVIAMGGPHLFTGCENLAQVIVLPETPPQMNGGSDWLYDFPVYVPCGTMEAYMAAVGWNQFTNYHQLGCLQIITEANPSNAGLITGEGDYPHGQICTLTATPNTDYHFVNWTKTI